LTYGDYNGVAAEENIDFATKKPVGGGLRLLQSLEQIGDLQIVLTYMGSAR